MSSTIIYSFTREFIPNLLNALGCMRVGGMGSQGDFMVNAKHWERFPDEGGDYIKYIPKIYYKDFRMYYIYREGDVYVDLFRMAKSLVPLNFDIYQDIISKVYGRSHCDTLIKVI